MAVAELWETLKQAILAYTGLSPTAFFTAVAVAAALYHVVSGIFAPPPPPRQRPREEPEAEPLPYALFAGKDASRALAKMSFEPQDLNGDTSGLGPFELDALQDWEYKFMSKYVKVGTIKKAAPAEDGTTSKSPETNEAVTTEAETEKAPEHKPREVSSEEVKEKEATADAVSAES
ncbi:unnamed protein product [Triticum turgidum subsp. durum]|uniref:Membrane steroid-binding protein 1 n=1 Tax=Triticum turgidum subsp. durum TaxID=4567 RepID=A0A9R0UU40_TRITD|nr:unnamed protein product [Triticum turgidum subsp. durum]